MHVSCQFALYPLGGVPLGPPIRRALDAIRRRGLEPDPGPMSTQVSGPAESVFTALGDAFEAAAEGGCVLVATVSNACPVPSGES
jgi:uncharacterized protein YqgV (UPF0045/DUF77 family)